jgi:hypothetical protein
MGEKMFKEIDEEKLFESLLAFTIKSLDNDEDEWNSRWMHIFCIIKLIYYNPAITFYPQQMIPAF